MDKLRRYTNKFRHLHADVEVKSLYVHIKTEVPTYEFLHVHVESEVPRYTNKSSYRQS